MRPRCASTGAPIGTGWLQNDQVVIHIVRATAAPPTWSPRRWRVTGRASGSPTCMARSRGMPIYGRSARRTNCVTANTPSRRGDTIFAPRMKPYCCYGLSCWRGRRKQLAESTRRAPAQARLDRELDAIMVLAPTNSHGRRLRKRYGKVRSHSVHLPGASGEYPPDNNGSERELRPTATYRKVTGGFRSTWGADLFAGVRSVIGTAARQGKDAYHAILAVLDGESAIQPG